ncbi:NAD-dependent epimerase/dehydratase family protein [Roseovarius sp. S4756]|uniref:NAD-dependent epimerase/dehydratase family protein n=1 Tax=Roseovarius maritimus TaxID=3342637 RepID=UPI00372635FB
MSDYKPTVPDGLADSTVCLTGFSGYVGSHLLATLRAAGIRPYLIPRPGTAPPRTPDADTATPWIGAEDLAEQITRLNNPVILNIAGHFVSRHVATDIPPLVAGNLEFPLLIFETLKLSGHSRIVNIGTSWEYSATGAERPANLYAQLKAFNAKSLESYASEAPFRAINLKLNDTYGGNDTRSKLLPMLKCRWLGGQAALLRSWAQPINLLHIADVQEGLLAAALHTEDLPLHTVKTAFLLGSETVKLGALTARLKDGIAPELSVQFKDMAEEDPALRDVWETAPRLPNWHPRISLDDGLRDYFCEA